MMYRRLSGLRVLWLIRVFKTGIHTLIQIKRVCFRKEEEEGDEGVHEEKKGGGGGNNELIEREYHFPKETAQNSEWQSNIMAE